jgi:hypothetical protein
MGRKWRGKGSTFILPFPIRLNRKKIVTDKDNWLENK